MCTFLLLLLQSLDKSSNLYIRSSRKLDKHYTKSSYLHFVHSWKQRGSGCICPFWVHSRWTACPSVRPVKQLLRLKRGQWAMGFPLHYYMSSFKLKGLYITIQSGSIHKIGFIHVKMIIFLTQLEYKEDECIQCVGPKICTKAFKKFLE